MRGIWGSSSASAKGVVNPKLEMPLRNLSKKDLLENMPEELSEMCWSCRHSDNGEPCGRCKACHDIEKAKEQLDHDMLVNKLTNE
jgi:7-cyano-7-deazaguanine synthase in queuosine biosynthesis